MSFIKNYDAIAAGFSKSRKNMRWEEIDYFFETYIGKKDTVSLLDVGCGSGRLLEQLSQSDYYDSVNFYLGIDESPEMIAEAQKNFSEDMFRVLAMQDLDKLTSKNFTHIFFIASFHHLKLQSERISTLKKLRTIVPSGAMVFMTNWALDSEANAPKYARHKVELTPADFSSASEYEEYTRENKYGSSDYSIKFGEFPRYYHGFSLEELDYIAREAGFEIVENRLFDTKKNFVLVLKNP